MPDYRLSPSAFEELTAIFVYGARTFGVARAKQYQLEISNVLTLLAERPMLGRSAEAAGINLRRHPASAT